MFCKKCGKNITDDANFCKYCGADFVNDVKYSLYRHGFVLFWLIFSIICYALLGVLSFFMAFTKSLFLYHILIILFSLSGIVGNIMIFRWRKIGWSILIIVPIIICISTFVYTIYFNRIHFGMLNYFIPFIEILGIIVGSPILWFVLHIRERKNNKNTWEQLK